jgi:AcrR family transcriptional regulator
MEPWMKELLEGSSSSEKMTEKQRRIFEAAVEIFSEKGYSAASTSEIAKRAGVAEGTIFRHYKTKKELLLSIAGPAMVKILAPFVMREFRGVFQGDVNSLEEFLSVMIENRIRFLEKNMSLVKVLMQELPFHPDLQEAFRKIILPQVLGHFEKVLKSLQEKGQVTEELPIATIVRLAAFSLIGYVLMRTIAGQSENAKWDDAFERQATIDFIVRGLAPRG